MSGFSFHNEDGKITSSHKVYDPTGYDKIQHERGIKFSRHETPTHADLDRHWIKQSSGTTSLSVRPSMNVSLSKSRIKAGGKDAARLCGVSPGATIEMSAGGIALPPQTVPARGPVYLLEDVPGIYAITVRKWPYRDWRGTLEVVG